MRHDYSFYCSGIFLYRYFMFLRQTIMLIGPRPITRPLNTYVMKCLLDGSTRTRRKRELLAIDERVIDQSSPASITYIHSNSLVVIHVPVCMYVNWNLGDEKMISQIIIKVIFSRSTCVIRITACRCSRFSTFTCHLSRDWKMKKKIKRIRR